MTRPIPYFDAHCDTISRCMEMGEGMRENRGHLDFARLAGYRSAGAVFAVFHDAAEPPPDGMLAEFRRQCDHFAREVEKNADIVARCKTAVQLRAAHESGKSAVLLSVEGAELLECDPERLFEAQERGVRSVNLTWNRANALSGSNVEDPQRGLSDRGRAFVRAAEELGIFVDVSHLSDAGFWDVVRMARRPVLATHSNARAVCPHTRNLTDDMFRAVVETGGAVGINLYARFVVPEGAAAMEDIVRHVDRFMELGGERAVCIGADFDGCDALAGGITNVSDMPMLYDALARRGYSWEVLEEIFAGNLLRVLSE